MWYDISWLDAVNENKMLRFKIIVQTSLRLKMKEIKCRRKEVKLLELFINDKLYSQRGGTICITGISGSGKTFVVDHIVRYLETQTYNCKQGSILTVKVNCMKLQDPKFIYSKVFHEICSKIHKTLGYERQTNIQKIIFIPLKFDSKRILSIITSNKINRYLERSNEEKKNCKGIHFPESTPKLTLLILEEIDELNSDLNLLVDLIKIAHKKDSRLIILGITNIIDFNEIWWTSKTYISNKNHLHVRFNSYSSYQISVLLLQRLFFLPGPVLDTKAIHLLSKSVSVDTGDMRRTFDCCQIAFKVLANNHKKTIEDFEDKENARQKNRIVSLAEMNVSLRHSES
jgi:Cdc6-like AAA superfamily ATPase